MGAQCKKVNQFSMDNKYSMMQPQNHNIFGQIFWFNNQKDGYRAIKRLQYDSDLQYISERISFAKEGDYNISTLVQLYDYNVIQQDTQQFTFWIDLQHKYFPQSTINQPFILLHFQYFPQTSSLKHIISSRLQQLKKNQTKYGKDYLKSLQKIKMYDYHQIDKLSSQQRQIINIYFQQIQIVRMIDHIIGALYFLNHFQIKHLAIRSQNIIVDEQGKYVLVDRQLFQRKTNYQIIIKEMKKHKNQGKYKSQQLEYILKYLSPEYIPYIVNDCEFIDVDLQKVDIYSVGLLALQMCLLDQQQPYIQYNQYSKTINFNQYQLNKRIVRAQQRYSQQFILLLKKMLTKDQSQRISYTHLIDQLNPLLQSNLQSIKQIHNNTRHQSPLQTISKQKYENETHFVSQDDQLKQKLIQIQKQFQKVMNNKFSLFNRMVNQRQIKEQQEAIFKKLAKIKKVNVAFQESDKGKEKETGRNSMNVDKRFISGKQLQQIVWKQYQNIKSKRRVK